MISREKLLELYTAMMKCRMLAQRAGIDNPQARWEAAFAAIALDLHARDTVASATGAAFARAVRGAPLPKVLAALRRKTRVLDPLAAATASARAHKAAKSTHLAIVFCGDAQATSAQWKKALTRAGKRGLPLIFVSLRTSGVAPSFVPPPTGKPEALACGVPLITVDGADLVAIYRVASESFSRARLRRISTLVDCVLEPGSDPVGIMETWLAARGYFTPAVRRKVRAAIARDLSADTA